MAVRIFFRRFASTIAMSDLAILPRKSEILVDEVKQVYVVFDWYVFDRRKKIEGIYIYNMQRTQKSPDFEQNVIKNF